MGSEIHKSVYTEEDYAAFEKAWLTELEFVKGLFAKGSTFFSNAYRLGYELEACILDENNQPAPCNKAILEELNASEFTNELANYDLEINGSVFELDSATTVKLQEDLSALWQMADRAARKFHTRLGLFGVFPNLQPEHFERERYQSQMMRYTMASQRIHELRHESIKLLFAGEDIVSLQRDDVMSEALSTSLQIHFRFLLRNRQRIIMRRFWPRLQWRVWEQTPLWSWGKEHGMSHTSRYLNNLWMQGIKSAEHMVMRSECILYTIISTPGLIFLSKTGSLKFCFPKWSMRRRKNCITSICITGRSGDGYDPLSVGTERENGH
ncbi:MAG: hypothetical protein ABXS92_02825 [Sulfurimonas sp.]